MRSYLFMTMAEIRKLLKLLDETTEDRVDFKNRVIHFQGYTFVFRDWELKTRESYARVKYSSKVTSAGFWRTILKYSMEHLQEIKNINDLNLEDSEYDLCYGASLKTLLPTLKFGGDESLFDVWMFVKTPEGYMFPATFYYGPTGTSIGGWLLYRAKKVFPPEFFSIINFSPFDLSHDKLDAFVEALELSLKMVPMTDFYGVSRGDHGYTILGVKNGEPYLTDLGWVYDEIRVDKQSSGSIDLNKRYYVEGYVEEQNYATWCVDCILEQEIEVPHYPIFIDGYKDRPVCEICDKKLKMKIVKYNSELNEGD